MQSNDLYRFGVILLAAIFLAFAMTLLTVWLWPVPAHAQQCTASFDPGSGNNGQGVGGRPASVTLHDCAGTGDTTVINNTFNQRFTSIQNTININNLNAQRGIAMAMAAGSLGISGGAAGAGSGKIAAALGFGEFQGQTSLSAGISYAVTKKLSFGAGVSVAPVTGPPMVGTYGSMTWIIN